MNSATANIDSFRNALTSKDYPRNLFAGHIHDITLKALEHQLEQRAEDLFFNEQTATAVRVLELPSNGVRHEETVFSNLVSFEESLAPPSGSSRVAPRRRFIFVGAGHSRAPLRITKRMMLHALTYHQVMPSFLRYLLPFGNSHYVRDFHSMGFRSASCINEPSRHLELPELGRSGRHIELCYSLKSVEWSEKSEDPWPIRQCSVHHRFDLETNRASWIVIKANTIIREEIKSQCEREDREGPKLTPVSTLISALDVHRIIAAWAGENWHWRINDLEAEVQLQTKRTLYVSLDERRNAAPPTRSPTLVSESSPKMGTSRTFSNVSLSALKRIGSGFTGRARRSSIPLNTMPKVEETEACARELALEDFTFDDLQCVQQLEDSVNEVHMILKANSKVIDELRNEYTVLKESSNCPTDLLDDRGAEFIRFDRDLSNIDKDLIMECARVEALLKLLADRKSLVQGILQYRNMEATKDLAVEAQRSSMKIERMTEEMNLLARKTKVETVSMRIITLVTLFFLPGTFISTLMSTPMVKFDSTSSGFSGKNIGKGALELYVLLSVPLVCLTFLAWFLTYRLEKRRNKLEAEKQNSPLQSWP